MTETPPEQQPLPPVTAPNFSISFQGIDAEAANRFGPILGQYVQEISRHVDIRGLDGVTVALDYPAALAQLDRGYETSHVLTPTTEFGVGVAMTPAVMRDGAIKSHIVFNAQYIFVLEDNQHEFWPETLHLLAHECAHVEVTQATDTAFPGMLLRQRYDDMISAFRWQIIDACWDEYAASRISAVFGADRTSSYEETFVVALRETRDRADDHIRQYRLHGDHGKVLADVSGQYGNLMKFASYLIGHLHGAGLERDAAATNAVAALKGHWFAPHFDRLEDALGTLWQSFGTWQSRDEFDLIGDIAEAVVAEGGVRVTRMGGSELYVDVPFTARTMPPNPFPALFAGLRGA